MSLADKLYARYEAEQEARAKRQELGDKRFDFMYKAVMYIILTGWTFIILVAIKHLFS